jgi:hypothetical protein
MLTTEQFLELGKHFIVIYILDLNTESICHIHISRFVVAAEDVHSRGVLQLDDKQTHQDFKREFSPVHHVPIEDERVGSRGKASQIFFKYALIFISAYQDYEANIYQLQKDNFTEHVYKYTRINKTVFPPST